MFSPKKYGDASNQDIGSHWYHSHHDDAEQLPGGLYGAFVVDPRPGTAQAKFTVGCNPTQHTDFAAWGRHVHMYIEMGELPDSG